MPNGAFTALLEKEEACTVKILCDRRCVEFINIFEAEHEVACRPLHWGGLCRQ